ncbi:MAG: GatB/YqeY domain-containing protein [Magnetococcales bacterium]|nr:GatB/YqeY domain-containing protein [Magnetococcales bacterium]
MEIRQRLTDDLKEAMKAKETARVNTLRMVRAAVLNKEKSGQGIPDDAAVIAIIRSQIKQRRDSAEAFRGGDREDAALKEEQEITILETYLPQALSDEEIETLIDAALNELGATTMKQMGQVMGLLKKRTDGRAEMGKLSALVKQRLSAL